MTQCERIEGYIKRFGSISVMEAFMDLGVTQLAARIVEMKARGMVFESDTIRAQNRFGDPVSYKRYRLKGNADGLVVRETAPQTPPVHGAGGSLSLL